MAIARDPATGLAAASCIGTVSVNPSNPSEHRRPGKLCVLTDAHNPDIYTENKIINAKDMGFWFNVLFLNSPFYYNIAQSLQQNANKKREIQMRCLLVVCIRWGFLLLGPLYSTARLSEAEY